MGLRNIVPIKIMNGLCCLQLIVFMFRLHFLRVCLKSTFVHKSTFKLEFVLRIKHRLQLPASTAIIQVSPFRFQLHWPKSHDLNPQTIYQAKALFYNDWSTLLLKFKNQKPRSVVLGSKTISQTKSLNLDYKLTAFEYFDRIYFPALCPPIKPLKHPNNISSSKKEFFFQKTCDYTSVPVSVHQ